MELLLILVAVLLPPLAVFLPCGICKHFWINVVLTLLGYLPGVVHAVWYIAKHRPSEPYYRRFSSRDHGPLSNRR